MYMRCYLPQKAEEGVSVSPRQVLNFFGSLGLPKITKGHITIDLKVQVIKGKSPQAPGKKNLPKSPEFFIFMV